MNAGRRTIWITRARPGAEATAERVAALGHLPVVAPLLEVRSVPGVRLDLDGVAALAFTSANGVRAFAALRPERELKVFAVGAATAQAARQAGFRTVLSTDGDVAALAAGIGARRRELKGAVLHPGAVELAGDLAGLLARDGVEVRTVPVYETGVVELSGDEAERLVRSDAVLLHSAKAAEALARLLSAHPAPALCAYGLSRAVMSPLADTPLAAKVSAPFPFEAAMLNLLDRSP